MDVAVDSQVYNDLEAQIDCMQDWVTELSEALQWLNSKEFEAMYALYDGLKAVGRGEQPDFSLFLGGDKKAAGAQ